MAFSTESVFTRPLEGFGATTPDLTDEVTTEARAAPTPEPAAPEPQLDYDPSEDIGALLDFVQGKSKDPKQILEILGFNSALAELGADPRAAVRRIPALIRVPLGIAVVWWARHLAEGEPTTDGHDPTGAYAQAATTGTGFTPRTEGQRASSD